MEGRRSWASLNAAQARSRAIAQLKAQALIGQSFRAPSPGVSSWQPLVAAVTCFHRQGGLARNLCPLILCVSGRDCKGLDRSERAVVCGVLLCDRSLANF